MPLSIKTLHNITQYYLLFHICCVFFLFVIYFRRIGGDLISEQYIRLDQFHMIRLLLAGIPAQTRMQLTILRSIVIRETVMDASGKPLQSLHSERILALNRFLDSCSSWVLALAEVEQKYARTEASAVLLVSPLQSVFLEGAAGAPFSPAASPSSDGSCGPLSSPVSSETGPRMVEQTLKDPASHPDLFAAGSVPNVSEPAAESASLRFTGPEASASSSNTIIDNDRQQLRSHKLSAQAAAGSVNLSDQQKWGQTNLRGDLLTAGAEFNGTFLVNNLANGRSEAKVSSGAEAKARAASLQGNSRIGSDDWNVYSKSEAAFAGAGAQAKAGIEIGANRFASVSAGAEAEAYLAKGEVTIGHSFHGVRIEVSAEGLAGVQAEAKGKISTKGVSGKIGLGPVGAGIKVDWSEAGT